MQETRDAGMIPGGGCINPLQCFHLESPVNKGAWRATVHSVPESWTRLKQLCMPIMDNNHMCIQPLKELVGVIQSLSGVWLFATPWTAAPQDPLSFTVSQSFLKLMSIESVMASNHFILCCPLLLLSLILPRTGVFSSEPALCIRWPKPQLFGAQPSLWSNSHIHTWLLEKP